MYQLQCSVLPLNRHTVIFRIIVDIVYNLFMQNN
jgi:hypothetical protein